MADTYYIPDNIDERLTKKQRETLIDASLNTLIGALLGYFALHIGTCSNYEITRHLSLKSVDKPRQEILEKYQVEVFDNNSSHPEFLSNLSEALYLENRKSNITVSEVELESTNYLKNSLNTQLNTIFKFGYGGLYYSGSKKISLRETALGVLIHEIAHNKTYDILEKDSDFKAEWSALSMDENGFSYYLAESKNVSSQSALTYNESFNNKIGFVTNYARTDLLEDVAEFVRLAETNPRSLKKMIFRDKNKIIIEKAKMLQKYNLIPKDFLEFMQIEEKFYRIEEHYWYIYSYTSEQEKKERHKEINDFITHSNEHIQKHPKTKYAINIHSMNSKLYVSLNQTYGSVIALQQAITEAKKGLMSEYKETSEYLGLLDILLYCHRSDRHQLDTQESLRKDGFSETGGLYLQARDEYFERLCKHDPRLFINGVNDFLKEKGLLE